MKPTSFLLGCLAASAASVTPIAAQSSILTDDLSTDIAEQTEALTAYERTVPRADVRINGRLGMETIDVVATRLSIDALLRRVARDCHRELVGLETLSRMPEVTVKLVDTDLRDALRWIGGSVGLQITLTTSELRVAEDLPPYPTRKELYERAYTGYFRALADHPESSMAASGAWNRARIDESTPSRALEAARAYDEIVERYPNSDLLADAMLRAGKLYGEANAWEEAAARFDALAGLKVENDYSIESRRLLADAHTRIASAAKNEVVARESARRALLVLDALDDLDETQNPEGRRQRYIIRSRAHSLAGEPVQAMRCLDLAIEYSEYGDQDPELAELRALAFDRAERNSDAVRAWLYHASLVTGEERKDSYVKAAIAANRGHQPLATLAIAKTATNEGFGDAVAPHADAALVALDMEPKRIDLFGDDERIDRGERLILRGMAGEAVNALRPVFNRQAALDEPQRVRLATALARALAEEKEIDEAMLVLRTTVESLTRVTQRQSLYQLAATLLEQAGEIERAIRALEGSL
ncbi:hypothetical protein Poly30_04970 [Planctomycetes bacterium Poly30]|uniref:Outer membrane protein assembly factor BamD n=1 Tax=Saltatorellus ferox TaxID=2528018 RepID=A0A518ELP6_9BACT|nr:hypothetical protein Poly30_04970 [Planctomycetes bacterium Poly30]